VYCVLCTVYFVLCTVYCVLCTVYCVLCTVYCVLLCPTVYCVLCTTVYYCVLLCTVLCTVDCVLSQGTHHILAFPGPRLHEWEQGWIESPKASVVHRLEDHHLRAYLGSALVKPHADMWMCAPLPSFVSTVHT
jgi:hypothetical protein